MADPSFAKVLDLVEYVDDQDYVTPLQVAKAFRVTHDEAEALLEHLGFDSGEGAGVYSVPVTPPDRWKAANKGRTWDLQGFLDTIDSPDQDLEDRLIEIRGDAPMFETKVLEGMAEMADLLRDIQARVSSIDPARKPRRRRRKRGELLRVRSDDSPDLAEMRRQAASAIEQAKKDGNKDAVYQTWYQRIEAQEEKEGVGKFSEPLEPPTPVPVRSRADSRPETPSPA